MCGITTCLWRNAGEVCLHFASDEVTVALTPYGLTRARIVFRAYVSTRSLSIERN